MNDQEKALMKGNAEFAIQLEQSLIRLEKNEDFKKLVNFYTQSEAIRYTHLMADPGINMSEKATFHRKEIDESLIGISRFVTFLKSIRSLAEISKKTLEDINKEATGTEE